MANYNNNQKEEIIEERRWEGMKISSLPEGGDICDVSFGYTPKMYEYTTLMSDILKLYEIAPYEFIVVQTERRL